MRRARRARRQAGLPGTQPHQAARALPARRALGADRRTGWRGRGPRRGDAADRRRDRPARRGSRGGGRCAAAARWRRPGSCRPAAARGPARAHEARGVRARAPIAGLVTAEIVERVLRSSRYRDVDRTLLARLAAEELPRARNADDAVKRVKRRLHQAVGAFRGASRASEITAAWTGDLAEPGFRAACADALRAHASTREDRKS